MSASADAGNTSVPSNSVLLEPLGRGETMREILRDLYGNPDRERRAMTEIAFNRDVSAELLSQAFADCEPETGTGFVARVKPTEFLEDQLPFIRGYAGAGVDHLEFCPILALA